MMRRRAAYVLMGMTFVGVACAGPAFAQAAAPAKPPAHEGSAEFALVATSGNTDTKTVGLNGDLTLRPSKWVYRTKASFVQNEVKGVVAARAVTGSFRASREFTKKVSMFGQVRYLRDRFSGIANRTAVEAGISAAWNEKGRQSVSADISGGYESEKRLLSQDVSTAVTAMGLRYRLKLSATADFNDEARVTQSLSTNSDYRFDHLAAVTAKLTTHLSLKVSNTMRYVHSPVPGFKRTDTATSMALVAKF
jgi:putative salt-induced outer membrane protein YdiY